MGNSLPATMLGSFIPKNIAIGHDFTCVYSNIGVKCFGLNDFGQLGIGNTITIGNNVTQLNDNLQFTELGTNFIPKHVSLGNHHGCAISTLNEIKCWGQGIDGLLGNNNITNIGDELNEMGDNLLPLFRHCSTDNPTNIPTYIPTNTPTNSPTNIPTLLTEIPTKYPTNIPSLLPSQTPTNIPTLIPSSNPAINQPSKKPTYSPTEYPTKSPTLPTPSPTDHPIKKPTFNPTIPTPEPSFGKTNSPTINLNVKFQDFRVRNINYAHLLCTKFDFVENDNNICILNKNEPVYQEIKACFYLRIYINYICV